MCTRCDVWYGDSFFGSGHVHPPHESAYCIVQRFFRGLLHLLRGWLACGAAGTGLRYIYGFKGSFDVVRFFMDVHEISARPRLEVHQV